MSTGAGVDDTGIPDDVIIWLQAGNEAKDASVAHMLFTRALDVYWQNAGKQDTPTHFERKLRRSLAVCCFFLKLYPEVLEHTSRGLQAPAEDCLKSPELFGELLNLEYRSCVALEDYDRALELVDQMLTVTPLVTMFLPLDDIRSQLVELKKTKDRDKKKDGERVGQQRRSFDTATEQELTVVSKDSRSPDRHISSTASAEGSSIGKSSLNERPEEGDNRYSKIFKEMAASSADLMNSEALKIWAQGPPAFIPTPDNVPDEAVACLEAGNFREPRDALNCYCQGLEIYMRAVGYQEVPSEFEQRALVLMAGCCLELDMLDDVIRHTTRVIKSGIETMSMRMCLAYRSQAYEQQGDIRKALADVEAFRVFDPLNKLFIERHINLQDRLKGEEKLEMDRSRCERMQQKQEVVVSEEETLSPDLGETDADTMKRQTSDDAVCSGEDLIEGADVSRDRMTNGETEQISLPSSMVDSVNEVDTIQSVDCAGVAPGAEAKKRTKKQEKMEAFRRHLEGEKIRQELLEKIARDQQKETEKAKVAKAAEDHSESPDEVEPPLSLKKTKKKKKRRKRTRRKTQNLRAARERHGDDSDSDESSDDSEDDGPESDQADFNFPLSDTKGYGRFTVLAQDCLPQTVQSSVWEDQQKLEAENGIGGDQTVQNRLNTSMHLLTQIVQRCRHPVVMHTGRIQISSDAHMRPDLSSGKYTEFRQEVIKRGKLACWICFVKEGGRVSEMDQTTGCCPRHPMNFWTPMLLWPREHMSATGHKILNERWVEIRPRPHDRQGGLKICDPRMFHCGGAECGYPHSEEEREAWILDRDTWRFRRIPERGRLELCRTYSARNFCSYGDRCLFAHGPDELREWRSRPNTRSVVDELSSIRNISKPVPTWLDEIRSELSQAHSRGETHLVCDEFPGLEVVVSPCNVCFISTNQISKYITRFQLLIVTTDQDRFLKRAALLGNDSGFSFRSDCPSCFVSSKGLLLEILDGQQPSSTVEIDIEFASRSAGCFVQDIFLDTGHCPYVHQAVAVVVAPEKYNIVLKKLLDAFEYLSPSNRSAIESALPDSASLLNAAGKILLNPPTTPDDYKDKVHSTAYVEEVFRHYQERPFSHDNSCRWNTSVSPQSTDETQSENAVLEHRNTAIHLAINRLSDKVIHNNCLLQNSVPRLMVAQVTSESDLARLLLMIDPDLTSEQKTGVTEVLDPRIHCPILIQGPPGVGKTRLLMEAARLLTAYGQAQVFVCTKSERSAQQCVKLLHQFRKSGLEVELIYACDTQGDETPAYDDIKRYQQSCDSAIDALSRVQHQQRSAFFVATLNACCWIVAKGLDNGISFTHILVDEASRITEGETAVALFFSTPETVVILAGDKNELYPYRHCQLAEASVFSQSLFTRLFNNVVQGKEISLTTQYTRHPALVQLSSSMFSAGATSHCVSTPTVNYAHPTFHQFAIFACVESKANQVGNDGSFCNMVEADDVIIQVTRLIENWPVQWGSVDASQVFVVSSEQRQLQIIQAKLKSDACPDDKAHLSQVRVGTPWELQGSGPRVVVISTVMTEDIDRDEYNQRRCFLSDAGMLYTAINEAKCLVLVVGDPYTLISRGTEAVQLMWRVYLQRCCDIGDVAVHGNMDAADLAMSIKLHSAKLSIHSPEFVPFFETSAL